MSNNIAAPSPWNPRLVRDASEEEAEILGDLSLAGSIGDMTLGGVEEEEDGKGADVTLSEAVAAAAVSSVLVGSNVKEEEEKEETQEPKQQQQQQVEMMMENVVIQNDIPSTPASEIVTMTAADRLAAFKMRQERGNLVNSQDTATPPTPASATPTRAGQKQETGVEEEEEEEEEENGPIAVETSLPVDEQEYLNAMFNAKDTPAVEKLATEREVQQQQFEDINKTEDANVSLSTYQLEDFTTAAEAQGDEVVLANESFSDTKPVDILAHDENLFFSGNALRASSALGEFDMAGALDSSSVSQLVAASGGSFSRTSPHRTGTRTQQSHVPHSMLATPNSETMASSPGQFFQANSSRLGTLEGVGDGPRPFSATPSPKNNNNNSNNNDYSSSSNINKNEAAAVAPAAESDGTAAEKVESQEEAEARETEALIGHLPPLPEGDVFSRALGLTPNDSQASLPSHAASTVADVVAGGAPAVKSPPAFVVAEPPSANSTLVPDSPAEAILMATSSLGLQQMAASSQSSYLADLQTSLREAMMGEAAASEATTEAANRSAHAAAQLLQDALGLTLGTDEPLAEDTTAAPPVELSDGVVDPGQSEDFGYTSTNVSEVGTLAPVSKPAAVMSEEEEEDVFTTPPPEPVNDSHPPSAAADKAEADRAAMPPPSVKPSSRRRKGSVERVERPRHAAPRDISTPYMPTSARRDAHSRSVMADEAALHDLSGAIFGRYNKAPRVQNLEVSALLSDEERARLRRQAELDAAQRLSDVSGGRSSAGGSSVNDLELTLRAALGLGADLTEEDASVIAAAAAAAAASASNSPSAAAVEGSQGAASGSPSASSSSVNLTFAQRLAETRAKVDEYMRDADEIQTYASPARPASRASSVEGSGTPTAVLRRHDSLIDATLTPAAASAAAVAATAAVVAGSSKATPRRSDSISEELRAEELQSARTATFRGGAGLEDVRESDSGANGSAGNGSGVIDSAASSIRLEQELNRSWLMLRSPLMTSFKDLPDPHSAAYDQTVDSETASDIDLAGGPGWSMMGTPKRPAHSADSANAIVMPDPSDTRIASGGLAYDLPDAAPSISSSTNGPHSIDSVRATVGGRNALVRVPTLLDVPRTVIGATVAGTIPVVNLTTHWMECIFSITGQQGAFAMERLAVVPPGESRDVPLLFAPRQTGLHRGYVQLETVTVDQGGQPLAPEYGGGSDRHTIAVRGFAEKPNLEVVSGPSLDFGAVLKGNPRHLPVQFVNHGTVPLNVLMALTQRQPMDTPPRFHLFRDEPEDGEVIPAGEGDSNQILALKVPPGGSRPFSVWASFGVPEVDKDDGGSHGDQVDVGYSTNLVVALDEAVSADSGVVKLANIALTGLLGHASLALPRVNEALEFAGPPGVAVTRTVPIRNVGGVPTIITARVLDADAGFSVEPGEVELQPGQQETPLHVTFTGPLSGSGGGGAEGAWTTKLEIEVQPAGPIYRLALRGQTVGGGGDSCAATAITGNGGLTSSAASGYLSSGSGALLCDRPVVHWGGVRVGDLSSTMLRLRNSSVLNQMVLRLAVTGGREGVFHLADSRVGLAAEAPTDEEFSLAPGEELTVRLIFAPVEMGTVRSALRIESTETVAPSATAPTAPAVASVFTVPLVGLGGRARLELRGIQAGRTRTPAGLAQPSLRLGKVITGRVSRMLLHVRNSGDVDAYVRGVAYDASARMLPDARVCIMPPAFVLAPGRSRSVKVTFTAHDEDSAPFSDPSVATPPSELLLASLCLYTGDELSRQQYRRYAPAHALPVDPAVGFGGVFEGEPVEPEEDQSLASAPGASEAFGEAFVRNMSCLRVGIIGTPPRPDEPWGRAAHGVSRAPAASLSVSELPPVARQQISMPAPAPATAATTASAATAAAAAALSPPRETHTGPQAQELEISPARSHETVVLEHSLPWAVSPASVRVEPGKPARVELTNYSEHELSFDLMWPAIALMVSPSSGTVPARSRIQLCVAARTEGHGRQVHLPAPCVPTCEKLFVLCDGRQQIVTVDVGPTGSVRAAAERAQQSGRPQLPVGLRPTVVPRPNVAPVTLQPILAEPFLGFGEVQTGSTAGAMLKVRNLSDRPYTWILSSVAPPFLRVKDRPGVFRSAYSAFNFERQSGVIGPGAEVRVAASFRPRNAGAFTQHWELRYRLKGELATTANEGSSEGGAGSRNNCIQLQLTGASTGHMPAGAAPAATVALTPATVAAAAAAAEAADTAAAAAASVPVGANLATDMPIGAFMAAPVRGIVPPPPPPQAVPKSTAFVVPVEQVPRRRRKSQQLPYRQWIGSQSTSSQRRNNCHDACSAPRPTAKVVPRPRLCRAQQALHGVPTS